MDLFDDGNDARNGQLDFKVNEQYAARFTHNRRRAELDQLREKYGDAAAAGGESDSSTDSEDDETEDEDGEQVTADVDAALLRTLAKIKKRDASIYDSSKRIFDTEHEHILAKAPGSSAGPSRKSAADKQKKMTLQDYQRQRVEELIKTSADPARALADATTNPARQLYIDDDEGAGTNGSTRTHAQEQEDLRRQVTAAFHVQDEDEGDDFFKPRRAGDGEGDDGDDAGGSYRQYLLSAIEGDDLDAAVRDALKDKSAYNAIVAVKAEGDEEEGKPARKGSSPGANGVEAGAKAKKRKRNTKQDDEDFLMNYVLNRGWVDVPSGSPKVPKLSNGKRTTSAKAEESDDDEDQLDAGASASNHAYGRDWDAEAAELESEDSFDSRADAFETAYNFRFESIADGSAPATVQSFARASQLKDSVRREDDARKRKREERKARKEKEKAEKMAELERYRDLQRDEIRERVRRILKESGAEEEAKFAHLDLDGDFDPDAHDREMQAAFDSGYYAHGEGAGGDEDDDDYGEDDDGKPVWDDDIDIDDILAQEEEYAEPSSSGKDKKSKKKEKKKAKNEQKALEKKKAEQRGDGNHEDDDDDGRASAARMAVDIDEEELQGLSKEEREQRVKDMVDKYHELDYEDMIGDMPTRFKYASVAKVDYGLTPVEILMADDRDLNEVVGLKMLQPYRKGKNASKRPPDLSRRLREFRTKQALKQQRREGKGKGKGKEGAASGANAEKPRTKRMGKKERMKLKASQEGEGGAAEGETKED